MKFLAPVEGHKSKSIASSYYPFLRNGVAQGNPYLEPNDRKKLQGHYPVILNLRHYSPEMVAMVERNGRIGARYFPGNNGRPFDDVQFFSAMILSKLLSSVGFTPMSVFFSGFIPPQLWQSGFAFLENLFSCFPLLRRFGYFYLVAGVRQ